MWPLRRNRKQEKDESKGPSRKRSAPMDNDLSQKRSIARGDEHHPTSNGSLCYVDGYRKLVQRERSITMDPLGFVLMKVLHGVRIPAEFDGFEPNPRIERINRRRTAALKHCFSAWTGWVGTSPASQKETALTDSMTKTMNNAWSDNGIYASHQDSLIWIDPAATKEKTGYSDIVVHRATNGKRDRMQDPAALLIEVGLERDHPMTKVHQALYCQKILLRMGLFVEPMLIAVVRVHAEHGDFHEAEIILFLAIPGGDEVFRVALLWCAIPKTLDDFASAFALIMQATEVMEDWKAHGVEIDYEYLGQHCCRIGDRVRVNPQFVFLAFDILTHRFVFSRKVFRCYDNRLRFSERRPDMYLEPDGFIKSVEPWIHITDSTNPLKFGDRGENPELTDSPNWLRQRKGQVMVLSSPRLPGHHYASSVQQMLHAVKELDRMHTAGYVHGDIRAYNMIFNDDGVRLIDFDFSGKIGHNSTRYPQGYVQKLKDGSRVGNAGDPIVAWHDWRALIMVLFDRHDVTPHDENRNYEEIVGLFAKRKSFLQSFAKGRDPDASEIEELKAFLRRIIDWDVSLHPEFEADLEKSGLAIKGVAP
jgi:RIO1 family